MKNRVLLSSCGSVSFPNESVSTINNTEPFQLKFNGRVSMDKNTRKRAKKWFYQRYVFVTIKGTNQKMPVLKPEYR